MLKLFGFGQNKSATKPKAEAGPSAFAETVMHVDSTQSTFMETLHQADMHRELVRVVLKDTLRRAGIPAGSIACETIDATQPSGERELFVHLVLLKWNEAIIRFAPLIQRELIANLNRFDPVVDHSKYIFSWRFGPDCEHPHQALPDREYWQTEANTAVPAAMPEAPKAIAPAPPQKPAFDLPHSDRDDMPSDFAPTQIDSRH